MKLIVLLVFAAACGSGNGKDSRTPTDDVVVADVDGGTIVGAVTPNTKKLGPSKTEARPLSYRECRALAMHVVEVFAPTLDADTMREATYQPNSLVRCDQPVFSDEIFDCVLAATTPTDLLSCMKYGNLLTR